MEIKYEKDRDGKQIRILGDHYNCIITLNIKLKVNHCILKTAKLT